MPTMIIGVRNTDGVSSSLIKREVFDAIYNFKPYQTPIWQFVVGSKQGKLVTGNPKFEIQEDVLVPYQTILTGNVAASGTAQTVACTTGEGAYFKVGDIIRLCTTNENAIITTAYTSNLQFTALDNSTALTATTAACNVIKVGSAFAEGSASAVALSTQSAFPFNYTQIFKTSVHMSGTQQATENYGGSDWVNQREKATEEFKLDIERMFIYGIRNIQTTAAAYNRKSSGLLDSSGMGVSDSSQYVGNDFCTEDYFFKTFCKALFAKGSNRKRLYAGPDTVLGINDFQKVKMQTRPMEQEYGYNVKVILTPFGELEIVWHPILSNDYTNWGIAVDPGYIKYRYLSANGENRDMQYQADISTPGTDAKKAQYLAEIGFHIAGGGQGVHRVLKSGATA